MKTTLVAVSGMSPAILTETLWALGEETPPVVPDDVVVITTTKGEEDISRDLLAKREDWGGRSVWETLRADLFRKAGLPERSKALQLSIRVIELPDDKGGLKRKAEDLRTKEENAEAANFIVGTLAFYADAEDNRLIASIAGGRKTMGALLYGAMSLLGKDGDLITHVLVNEPFDTCRGFFYPDQPIQELEARPFGQPPLAVRAEKGQVELAELPFVPLRNRFAELNEPRLTFQGLVDRYCRSERPERVQSGMVRLSFDGERGIVKVDGREVTLAGRSLVVMGCLFERAKAGKEHLEKRVFAVVPVACYIAEWKQNFPFHHATSRLAEKLDESDLNRAHDEIRKALKEKKLENAAKLLFPSKGFGLKNFLIEG